MDERTPPAPIEAGSLAHLLGARGADVRVLDATDSTNADAAAWARDGAPDQAVVTADVQRAGRGRLDRSFTMPPRTGLAVSLVWRPDVPLQRWTWAPLAVGLAVDATLTELGVTGSLKWPNDVLVADRKISGILLERVETPGTSSAAAAIVGVGLNVDLTESELPVPHATSLRICGADDLDRTRVLARLVAQLDRARESWEHGDPRALREAYVRRCDTVGRAVEVSLPDGTVLHGTAETVDDDGRLVVAGRAVSAGDVTHVRRA